VVSKGTAEQSRAGAGLPIADFRVDAAGLSPAAFEQRHGSGFLLLSTAGMKNVLGGSSTELLLFAEEKEDAAERTAGLAVSVYPVRAASASHTHLITVGRTSKNDLTFPDISVSRFHAFIKRGPNGEYQIIDAGSSNGTSVNGFSVCTKQAGPPTNLKNGDNIRFGQVDTTFLDASALQSFVLKFDD
jgi:hypothetical protein